MNFVYPDEIRCWHTLRQIRRLRIWQRFLMLVGCLMYAMVCACPDLAHVVSKYMSKPGRQHWEAVKWIFKYYGHGIVFGNQQGDPLVVAYVNSDYAGDLDNRRSIIGYVFTISGGPVCLKSTI